MRFVSLLGILRIATILVLAVVCVQGTALAQEKATVHVVAVRGECQGARSFSLVNNRMVVLPGPTEAQSMRSSQTILTRFIDDDEVKTEITAELRKVRNLKVVDRIEDSRIVLQVCSFYWADTMTSRFNFGNKVPDRQRIAAVAIAVPAARFVPEAAGYDESKREAVWKLSTILEFNTIMSQNAIRIGSPVPREDLSPSEIAKRFAKEIDEINKRGAAYAGPPTATPGTSTEISRPALRTDKGGDPIRPPAAAQPEPDEDNKVKIDTSMVVVPVSVMDRTGKYVPGLRETDFSLFENGIKQEISDFGSTENASHVALVLDMSGSTRYRVDEIQQAAMTFIEQLRPQDQVMVVAFDSLVRVACEFTGDRKLLKSAIFGTRTGGSTRAYDALDLVLTERLEKVTGRKAIVVFSDGLDTASILASKEDVMNHIEESGTLVYSIRFNTIADIGGAGRLGNMRIPERVVALYADAAGFLMNIADRSGGRFYDVDNIKDTTQAFVNIADELRRQYWLGYYPSNQSLDGTFRKIKVSVTKPEVAVRARDGYRAKQ